MKFKPLYDRVLIKRIESEAKTASGILLPETAQEKPVMGEIIAVGSGLKLENGSVQALIVKVGDKVLFPKWGGSEIKLEGVEYIILKESELLGIIEK
jgi:chaperonin GroES